MPLVDRCIFQAAAGGLADFVVFHAVAGYLTPSQAGAVDQALYPYAAEVRDTGGNITAWETGRGKWLAASSTLQRGTVEFSSAANAKVSFLAAPVVAFTLLAADLAPTLTQWGSVATAAAGFIPAGVNSLATAGYATAGDGGAATYVRASGSTLGGFQSADGQWWQINAPDYEVNVKQFGAVGDGVHDDAPAIQAAVDLVAGNSSTDATINANNAIPKIVRFPAVPNFYRLGSVVSTNTRFPHSVGGNVGYDAIWLMGMKNITLRGELDRNGGRPKLIYDSALNVTGNTLFGAGQDQVCPALSVNSTSGYHTSLAALATLIAPIEIGTNYMTLTQGSLSLFPIGDIVRFEGGAWMTAMHKIVATDSATNRVYFEKAISQNYSQMIFPVMLAMATGATKLYIETTHILIQAVQTFYGVGPTVTLDLTLDDNSILHTSYNTNPASDAGGAYIVIANAIPAGRTVPQGNTFTLTQTPQQHQLAMSETARQSICFNLVNDVGGAKTYPYLSATSNFYNRYPENITIENLELHAFVAPCISTAYNISFINCMYVGNPGEGPLLGLITNLIVRDCIWHQYVPSTGGFQLAPQGTRDALYERCEFLSVGSGGGEECENLEFRDCTFLSLPNGPLVTGSGFVGLAGCKNGYMKRCRINLTAPTTGQMTQYAFSSYLQDTGTYESWTVDLDECIFEIIGNPGANRGGYALSISSVSKVSIRNCTFKLRDAFGMGYVSGGSVIFENNYIEQIDCIFNTLSITPMQNIFSPQKPVFGMNFTHKITGNTFILQTINQSLPNQPAITFGWSPVGDVGYLQAAVRDNTYVNYLQAYIVAESLGYANGHVLSSILISNDSVQNPQSGFGWDLGPSQGTIIPLVSCDGHGGRTWCCNTQSTLIGNIIGGFTDAGDIIIYKAAGWPQVNFSNGIVARQTCTNAGSFAGSGTWSNATDYTANAWVRQGGVVYRSLQASGPSHGGPQTPGSAPAYWGLPLPGVAFGGNSFRTELWQTAPPTSALTGSGYTPFDPFFSFQIGDVVYNTAPVAGGTPGWVCTTAGNPGVWKAMANLAP